MSYNGSGTFLINSAGQPVVANTVISATVFNALTSDLATGLSTAITKDGQTTITANIPFGSNKITGLGSGTAATDAANLSQVQSTVAKLVTVTGTDTITGSMSPQLTAYAAGQLFYFVANAANTGPVTINIDSLGAKAITRDGSTALAAGDINSGEVVVVIYDGTRFQMINAANSFGNTTINGTLTVTGNTGLQANVSITSTLSVGGTFAVTGAATLGSTLAVTGKSDLPTVSTASINAAVALVTTGTVTNLTASGASIASANIGNLQFTAASIASINAGVAVITNLTATGASIASMNAGVALLTTATVTSLTATGASVASANVGTAVVTGLTVTNASIASLNAGTATITTGNLTFSSTGQRITGDMSNATFSSRLAFQSSTTNGNTTVNTLPNGTATTSQYQSYNAADPTNSSLMSVGVGPTEMQLQSAIRGTGTYLPMTFYTGGSERMRLDTSGNLGIGTASPSSKLSVGGNPPSSGVLAGVSAANSISLALSDNTNSSLYVKHPTGLPATIGTDTGGSLAFATNGFTERMRIDSTGNVGIGGTAEARSKVHTLGTLPTSGAVTIGYNLTGTIPSGTTSIAVGYQSFPTTQAAAFTLASLYHFGAYQNTIGASSAITNQIGYYVDSGLTGATNNYGFYSNIASGTNRWNFFANGTANNYFAGNVGIGATDFLYRAEVYDTANSGTGLRIRNESTGASASANLVFGTNIDGQLAYIAVPCGSATDANQLVVANRVNHGIIFRTNNTNRASITAAGNIVAGASAALATTATDGFLYVPTCAGTPTGTPTAITGMAPIVVNTTNNKLYFYSGGAWRDAGP